MPVVLRMGFQSPLLLYDDGDDDAEHAENVRDGDADDSGGNDHIVELCPCMRQIVIASQIGVVRTSLVFLRTKFAGQELLRIQLKIHTLHLIK